MKNNTDTNYNRRPGESYENYEDRIYDENDLLDYLND